MAKFRTHIYKSGSAGGHLRIVLESGQPIFEGGVKVGDKPGRFADFVNGEYVTDSEADIKKLRSMPTFGVDFVEITDEDEKASSGKQDSAEKEIQLEKLTKSELLSLAKEKGVEADESLTKAQIIERITAAK